MKYTQEQFIKLLQDKYEEPFELIEYNGSTKEGKIICGYCKHDYTFSKIGILLNNDRKHLCSHCFASQYGEKVLKVLEEEENLEFIQFSYNNRLHKPTVIYKCLLCGELTEKPYVEFLKYSTCIHCGKNAKRQTNNIIQSRLPQDFTILEDYKGQYNKILFKHKCGFIFKIRPKDLISGHSYCPKCSKKASKGERKIIDYLEQENINFIKEKVFDWSGQKRFDFYLPDYNLVIEYMGIQHYKEVPNFFLSLEEQQQIDFWKKTKALEHHIDYLDISYLQFNDIENILAQRLKENT